MSVNWRGPVVAKAVKEATRKGIDRTMSKASVYAKTNHPGWVNQTGTAEGSIRIVQRAREVRHQIVGIWGSVDVDYMIWLELKHGSALRGAADAEYPSLTANIRAFL